MPPQALGLLLGGINGAGGNSGSASTLALSTPINNTFGAVNFKNNTSRSYPSVAGSYDPFAPESYDPFAAPSAATKGLSVWVWVVGGVVALLAVAAVKRKK